MAKNESETNNRSAALADLEMQGWRSIVRHAVRTHGALVIAMEGNHPISEMHDLKQRGIRVCLKKPIIYDDIRRAIRRNIEQTGRCELSQDESTFNARERMLRRPA